MPLSVNVGLSRKSSKDYQSTGYSLNLTAELDQSLLARPEELQAQIGALYAHARQALDQQAGQPASPASPAVSSTVRQAAPVVHNGRLAPATQSQKRAISAICRRLGTDPEYESRQLIGVGFAELSVKQASELIDDLKSTEPSSPSGQSDPGRNGGGQ